MYISTRFVDPNSRRCLLWRPRVSDSLSQIPNLLARLERNVRSCFGLRREVHCNRLARYAPPECRVPTCCSNHPTGHHAHHLEFSGSNPRFTIGTFTIQTQERLTRSSSSHSNHKRVYRTYRELEFNAASSPTSGRGGKKRGACYACLTICYS